MKQIIATIAITVTIIFLWFGLQSNYIKAWTSSDFYDPICSIPFDVLTKGTTLKTSLEPRHPVTHGFSLTFPAPKDEIFNKNKLDGKLGITISSKSITLFTGSVTPPLNPKSFYSNGEKTLILFYLEIPFKEFPDDLTIKITVEEPILTLSNHKNEIKFEVFPYYGLK